MALDLPIRHTVTIKQRRAYYIEYTLCPDTPPELLAGVQASAFPLFSKNTQLYGFFDGHPSVPPELQPFPFLFTYYMRLWKQTGTRTADRATSTGTSPYAWPVFTQPTASPSPALPCSLQDGVLRVTIPFGATFSRGYETVGPDANGVTKNVWDEDWLPTSDPMHYAYSVVVGGLVLGEGEIWIEIEPEQPPPPPPGLTICSVSDV